MKKFWKLIRNTQVEGPLRHPPPAPNLMNAIAQYDLLVYISKLPNDLLVEVEDYFAHLQYTLRR